MRWMTGIIFRQKQRYWNVLIIHWLLNDPFSVADVIYHKKIRQGELQKVKIWMVVSSIFQNMNVISVFALSHYYKRSYPLRTEVNSADVSIGISKTQVQTGPVDLHRPLIYLEWILQNVTFLWRTAGMKNLTASIFYICVVAKQTISFVSSAVVSILSPYSATRMSVCTDITAVLHY
jgi:hypothetical protein